MLQGRDFHNVMSGWGRRRPRRWRWRSCPGRWQGLPAGRGAGAGDRAAGPGREAGPVVVSAVAGLAGVGKTALAIQAAHAARAAGWFGGGVLFIDLHGYDETRVEPGQALDALLRALGILVSTSRQELRSEPGCTGRCSPDGDPVLIIADNASSEAQVRPVLPGAGPHRVVVTSRHTLAGLGPGCWM